MFQLTINEKGGQTSSHSFDKNEITIGRVQGNDVVLPKGNISKRHSRIVLKDGKFIIVDLKSTNGTYVNGKKITAPQVIKATDKIYIGDYTLQLGSNGAAQAESRSGSLAKGAKDEIDLFGGDAADDQQDAAPPPRTGSPGLIDDNFDQEFDVAAEPPQPKAAKGAPAPQKSRLPAPKPVEPPPEENELDLDGGGGFELELDRNQAPSDDSLEADAEPEPEPEPPKAPVVPMKAKSPVPPAKSMPAAKPKVEAELARPATATPSRAVEPARAAKGKGPLVDLDEDDLPEEPPAPPLRLEPKAPSVEAPKPAVVAAPAVAPQLAVAPMMLPAPAPAGDLMSRAQAIDHLHVQVVEDLGLRAYELSALKDLKERVTSAARAGAQRLLAQGRLAGGEDLDALAKAVAGLAVDMELIGDLVADEAVLQIVVTADRQIWAERQGLEPEGRFISSEDQVVDLIKKLGVLGGATPSAAEPLVDVRLRDGSRVIASLPPLSFRGPTLVVRKATRDAYNLESFVEAGTLSAGMARFIEFCVANKRNILLSMGPGVSASATLNALAFALADDERVVTIEGGVELHTGTLKNITALEPRKGQELGHLVQHAVMLQPDRVFVGSFGGPSAREVITAFGSALDGSFAGYPASSPGQALDRLSLVELAKDFAQAPAAARRMVATAFPIVLQEHRFPEGGSRRITQVSELVVEGDEVAVNDIFVFRPEGADASGVITGRFVPTGHVPGFVQELVDRGNALDMDIFKE